MVETVIGTVVSTAWVLADDGQTARVKLAANRVVAELQAGFDGVRGNRSKDAPLTWSDLRYLLAGALRAALAELERGKPTDEVSVVNEN